MARLPTGTTSATILTRSIFREGCKAVAAGMNPTDVRRGIEMSVKLVIAELKSMAVTVEGTDRIRQVPAIPHGPTFQRRGDARRLKRRGGRGLSKTVPNSFPFGKLELVPQLVPAGCDPAGPVPRGRFARASAHLALDHERHPPPWAIDTPTSMFFFSSGVQHVTSRGRSSVASVPVA